jgi:putative ABC transport system substrate-binding protein
LIFSRIIGNKPDRCQIWIMGAVSFSSCGLKRSGERSLRHSDFIKIIAGLAAILPVAGTPAAGAEPADVVPVVGFLNSQTALDYQRQLAAFLDALADGGYIEGRNVKIEYRWAENQPDRLPGMVADLIEMKVAVIAATSTISSG